MNQPAPPFLRYIARFCSTCSATHFKYKKTNSSAHFPPAFLGTPSPTKSLSHYPRSESSFIKINTTTFSTALSRRLNVQMCIEWRLCEPHSADEINPTPNGQPQRHFRSTQRKNHAPPRVIGRIKYCEKYRIYSIGMTSAITNLRTKRRWNARKAETRRTKMDGSDLKGHEQKDTNWRCTWCLLWRWCGNDLNYIFFGCILVLRYGYHMMQEKRQYI